MCENFEYDEFTANTKEYVISFKGNAKEATKLPKVRSFVPVALHCTCFVSLLWGCGSWICFSPRGFSI